MQGYDKALTLVLVMQFVAATALAGDGPGDQAPRPNIILMMADDMGFSDLGCYGSEIATPHLDRLAAHGLRFTRFYNAGRCCPTRAALLTGQYQHAVGVGHMSGDRGYPSYRGVLGDRCVTIAEALKRDGYRTLAVGKWHVGSKQGQWPLDRGFDRYFGTPAGGGVYFRESLDIRKQVFFVEGNRKVELPEDFYVTDALTGHAIRFIEEAASGEAPFFLYFAHIAPHWPLQAHADDIARYRGRYRVGWDEIRRRRHARQIELGLVEKGTRLSPRDPRSIPWEDEKNQDDSDLRMAVYAAQIDRIDQNVGRLFRALEGLGLTDDTVFLFLSDNGSSHEGGQHGFSRGKPGAKIGTGGSYASAGLSWANAANTPFRLHKHWVHEGGISSPLIVHWPRKIAGARRGTFVRETAHVMDLLPTCLDLAGVAYPEEHGGHALRASDGISLRPLLEDEPLPDRGPLFWEHEGNRAVRVGRWKLVAEDGKTWELYDLSRDRTELDDLASSEPERVRELEGLYRRWAAEVGVRPWPVRKPPATGTR